MVRISKQEERRGVSRRSTRPPAKKTGPKPDNLPQGFKPHANMIQDAGLAESTFIGGVR